MQLLKHHWTLLEKVEVSVLIAVCGMLLLLWSYWRGGGRDSYYESSDAKRQRWQSVFADLEDSSIASIPPDQRAALAHLAQKCGTSMSTLLAEPMVDLSHKGLDDNDGAGLGALMRTSSCLEALDLQQNEIGNNVAAAMAEAAPHAKKLQSVNLTHNALLEEAGEALGAIALRCETLKELHAGQNRLSDSGGRAVAAALREPACGLRRLTLPRCELGDESAYALGAALNLNKELRMLSLWGNPQVTSAAHKQLRTAWGERGNLTLDDDFE